MPRKKPEKPINPVEEALLNIYRDTDGSVPDLAHFERRKRPLLHPLLIVAGIFTLFVVGASFVSMTLFASRPGQGADVRAVRLLVRGPETVVSGSKATFAVTYGNSGGVLLRDVAVQVDPPLGFVLEEARPKPSATGMVWNLGMLAPEATGVIELTGTLVQGVGDGASPEPSTAQFSASMRYTPLNFQSPLTERAETTTTVQAAPVTLEMEGPEQFVRGDTHAYTMTLTNRGEFPLTALELRMQLPEDVRVIDNAKDTARPVVAFSLARFAIGALGPGDAVTRMIRLTTDRATSTPSGLTEGGAITSAIGFFVRDQFFPQANARQHVTRVDGGFVATLAVNGNTGAGTHGWDMPMTITVRYENRGKVAAEGVEIRVAATGDALDWATVENAQKGVVRNGEIRWTRREVPLLALVKAGGSGSVSFSVRTRTADDEALKTAASDARIRVEGTALIGAFGRSSRNEVVTMSSVDVQVNTNLTLRAAIRYFSEENIPLGLGPLPPRVGEGTTYRVFLTLRNRLHEVRGIRVRAPLPPFVEWTGRTVVGAGDIAYDALTRTVEWSLNRMPTSVGNLVTQFEIRVTPLSEHAKTSPIIISDVTLEAIDSVTLGTLTARVGALTTALPDDPEAKGKGIVIE